MEVGCCPGCGRRVQGRHPLQTSDALGAANVHLGPGAVTLLVLLHKRVGVPLEKMATLLRERFGLTVTPGGLVAALHRAARVAAPTYAALCEQVRGSPVVTPDETGWRVAAVLHWLWVFATPDTTVYPIRPRPQLSRTRPRPWARTSPGTLLRAPQPLVPAGLRTLTR